MTSYPIESKTFDGEKGIFSGPAFIEAGDDVYDFNFSHTAHTRPGRR